MSTIHTQLLTQKLKAISLWIFIFVWVQLSIFTQRNLRITHVFSKITHCVWRKHYNGHCASKEFRPSMSTHVDTKDTAGHITSFPIIINATNQNITEKQQLHMKHFSIHEQTEVSAWQREKQTYRDKQLWGESSRPH